MRITNIKIENFGIYRDLCEIHFEYNSIKKVTLFTGENGSGKTTLLNSIKTAIYGPMLFGSKKNSNGRYIEFIRKMLNADALKDPFSEYGIEIDITINLPTYSGSYKITRTWNEQNNKIKEEVSVFAHQKKLNEVEAEYFFNMLYKMYPIEIFELYYLDGEKIDQLSIFNGDIYSLIESSMNIDLFKVLRNDLETYAVKKHKSDHLNEMKLEKDYNFSRIRDFENKISGLTEHLKEYEKDEITHEQTVEIISRKIESSKQNIPDKIKNAQDELKDVKKVLQKHINELVPILLLQREIEVLKYNLEVEQRNEKALILNDLLDDQLKSKILIDMNDSISEEKINRVFEILKNQYSPNEVLVHNLNSDEFHDLIILSNRINLESKSEVVSTFEKYYALQKRIRILNEELNEYDEDYISKLVQDLIGTNETLQSIRVKIDKNKELLLKYKVEIENLKNKNKSLENEIWKGMKSENITEVVKDMRLVIDRYIESIKAKKILGIEAFTKEMFEALIRKKGFVKDVKISESEVYIETSDNNRLSISSLSSGERQLFILSIIYALFRVSERSTPVIFDTLLGRLDKNHQQEVMSRFIASCPDQVIILATDSELENIKKETLSELVNMKYSIDLSKDVNRIERVV